MILAGEMYVVIEHPDSINHIEKRILLAIVILGYFGITAQVGIIGTMMIMFTKHSQTISKA